jgi:hypothetical protein
LIIKPKYYIFTLTFAFELNLYYYVLIKELINLADPSVILFGN